MINHIFRKGAAVLLTAALLVFSSSAFSQDLKIGVVDINALREIYRRERYLYAPQ